MPVRVLIAALVFLPFTLWRGLPRRLLAGFWLAGALQFGITYLCLYRSFQVLTVPEVLLFTVLTPIYVTLLDDALARRFSPWALLAALVAVGGGVIIRFDRLEGDYLLGFVLLQIGQRPPSPPARCCVAACSCTTSPVQPLHRFFGHFFLGALVLVLPSFLLFGNPQISCRRRPCSGACWPGWGCSPTALGLYWWVKGSTRVDAGTLAIMNELHVPAGLLVNLLIWNRDFDLPRLAAGAVVILLAMALLRIGRPRAGALA